MELYFLRYFFIVICDIKCDDDYLRVSRVDDNNTYNENYNSDEKDDKINNDDANDTNDK